MFSFFCMLKYYITHSHCDISKASMLQQNTKPTKGVIQELVLVLDYLWPTEEKGFILHQQSAPLELICHVDALYLAQSYAMGRTGYCLSLVTHAPLKLK